MEQSIAHILNDINTIKYMLIAILILFGLIIFGLAFLFFQIMRVTKREFGAKEFYHEARELLDKGMADEVIMRAKDRIASFPKDKYAHWYLAQAYHDKKKYTQALEVFTILEDIAPAWREKYIEPHLNEIKAQLRNTKPEVVHD